MKEKALRFSPSSSRMKALKSHPLSWISFLNSLLYEEDPADCLRRLHLSLLARINPDGRFCSAASQQDVAFRMLAASQSNVPPLDEDANVDVILRSARRLEQQVVRIIREIGETVVNAERPRNREQRDDFTFSYFCDRAILPMLVDIAKAQPPLALYTPKVSSNNDNNERLHGVVWSAKVKAQVLRTVNFIVAGVKDKTSLYYLLSHHSINRLVLSFLPLSQWNDPGLKEMISPYADLLKTLSVQVRKGRVSATHSVFSLAQLSHAHNSWGPIPSSSCHSSLCKHLTRQRRPP